MNVDERIDANRYRVTIFAADFKPMLGGVAEYTFHLANELHKLGLLDRVITPVQQTETYAFKVEFPQIRGAELLTNSKNKILKKLDSVSYILQLYGSIARSIIRQKITTDRTLFIFNWIDNPLVKQLIPIFHTLKVRYGIILYGKDIIVGLRADPDRFDFACKNSSALIVITDATLNLFHELYPLGKTQDHCILKPGIDITYLSQSTDLALTTLAEKLQVELGDKTIISTVARLVKRKGVDLAIQALEPLLRENKNLIYAIAGDGEEYPNLQNLIESLNLESQVKLLGSIDELEKFALLQESSIFIMPNHRLQGEDFEGFGISFIEAAYFKNVTIGGRSGGAAEAIDDGKTGFLIDTDREHAVDRLRDLLRDLIAKPDLRAGMAEVGHQFVVDNFQSSYLVKKFADDLNAIVFDLEAQGNARSRS
jgi:phosphatidyl-myo-inositol dimannoside synthase